MHDRLAVYVDEAGDVWVATPIETPPPLWAGETLARWDAEIVAWREAHESPLDTSG